MVIQKNQRLHRKLVKVKRKKNIKKKTNHNIRNQQKWNVLHLKDMNEWNSIISKIANDNNIDLNMKVNHDKNDNLNVTRIHT